MQKGDELAGSSVERDLVDETGALVLGLGELAGDVVRGEGDVVDAGAIFFEKFGDRAFVGCGFEKLDVDISGGKKCGANFLGLDLFAAFANQSERVFIIGDSFIQ